MSTTTTFYYWYVDVSYTFIQSNAKCFVCVPKKTQQGGIFWLPGSENTEYFLIQVARRVVMDIHSLGFFFLIFFYKASPVFIFPICLLFMLSSCDSNVMALCERHN